MISKLLEGTGVYLDADDLFRFDGAIDVDAYWTASSRVGRNETPALMFDLVSAGSLDPEANPAVVADAWSGAEFPTVNLEPRMWVDLFRRIGYTEDGVPATPRTEPVKLYRGCHHDRRFGMSWTVSIGTAEWFADRDFGRGTGKVYVHVAKPAEILAVIDGGVGRMEAEFVLDPFHLNDDNVTEDLPLASGKGAKVGARLRAIRAMTQQPTTPKEPPPN